MSGPSTLAPDLKYRLLLEISQKISRTLDLPSVLKHLLESVRSVIAYDATGIFVLNRSVPLTPEPEEFLIAGMATVGFGQAPRQDDPMRRSGKGIVGHVVRTGETVIAPDVSVDRHYVVVVGGLRAWSLQRPDHTIFDLAHCERPGRSETHDAKLVADRTPGAWLNRPGAARPHQAGRAPTTVRCAGCGPAPPPAGRAHR